MADIVKGNGADTNDQSRKCKVCKIVSPDANTYIEHLESREHRKALMKSKYGEKYLEAKAKLEEKNVKESANDKSTLDFSNILVNVSTSSIDKSEESPETKHKLSKEEVQSSDEKVIKTSKKNDHNSGDEDSEEEAEVFTCYLCKKICTGFLSYNLHLNSKKHKNNLKAKKLMKQMKEKKLIPEDSEDEPKEESSLDQFLPQSQFSSTPIECKVCNKVCTGPQAFKQHCNGAAHQKKLKMQQMLKDEKFKDLAISANGNTTPFNCNVCSKAFSGITPYTQHMKSTVHLKQVARSKQMGDIKSFFNSSEENSKIQCKECGKQFSGPVPFQDHLASSVHDKLKKKDMLIDNLQKKYPELFISPIEKDSDDGSEEDEILCFGCKICNIFVNGPEAANDHFSSQKHKKAKKQKEQFRKFKKQQKERKILVVNSGEKKSKKMDSDDESSECDSEFDIVPEPNESS